MEPDSGNAKAHRAGTASIVAIHLFPRPRSRDLPPGVERATALADRGLEGDRHARLHSKRQVLLAEYEELESLGLTPGTIREQITVRGLPLMTLAHGARLRAAGAVLLEVTDPCEPCERMNEIRPGLMDRLDGRRGRFVRVIEGGTLAVGDALVVEAR